MVGGGVGGGVRRAAGGTVGARGEEGGVGGSRVGVRPLVG